MKLGLRLVVLPVIFQTVCSFFSPVATLHRFKLQPRSSGKSTAATESKWRQPSWYLSSRAFSSPLFAMPADGATSSEGNGSENLEVAALVDQLIDEMLEATPSDLPAIVSRELKLVSSPSFFMAVADKSDSAESEVVKSNLAALATAVMTTLEVIVQKTEEKSDVASETLQSILACGAEDDGEFLVPLSPLKSASLRQAAKERLKVMDEAFLSTVNAWMRKSQDDGLSGMVSILQTVLQHWAALTLTADPSIGAGDDSSANLASPSDLLDKVLATDASQWPIMIPAELGRSENGCSKDALVVEVQKRIETIVLNSAAGSYSQRVQAEFLRELTTKIEEGGKAAGGGDAKAVVME